MDLDSLYSKLNQYSVFYEDANGLVSDLNCAIESSENAENLDLYFTIDEMSVCEDIKSDRSIMITYRDDLNNRIIPEILNKMNGINQNIQSELWRIEQERIAAENERIARENAQHQAEENARRQAEEERRRAEEQQRNAVRYSSGGN